MLPPQRPSRYDSKDGPVYILVIAAGAVSFVVGAIMATILINTGGQKVLVIAVCIALIVFSAGLKVLMKMRGVE